MKTKIDFLGKQFNLKLVFSNYDYKNRIAIQVVDLEDGDVFGVLTTNIEEDIEENEFFVKTWSENSWALDVLNNLSEYFEDTGKRFQSGFVQVPVWRIK
jgi:hypothetical protein